MGSRRLRRSIILRNASNEPPILQKESIETLQAFGYGVTEPDDRNIVIRDVKTISRLYPTEYAAVLGPSQLRSRWSDRGAARGMRRGAVSPTE